MSKKLIAEVIGTFILVFVGCGAIVFMGASIGTLGISLAFGLAIVAAAYSLGPISGAHLNPAVSIGMVAAGRMEAGEAAGYVVAQCVGAILAALAIMLIAQGAADPAAPGIAASASGWGAYSMTSAFVYETLATFLFVTVILGATQAASPGALAGLAIGLTLTALHLVGISVSGNSLNPARSLGPALFSGSTALGALWLYIVAPILGGIVAGLLFRARVTQADEAPANMVKAQPDIR